MIDPCIYKVYKQDKKVFIPDFGAIIYSEVSDSIDFNDLLTFDDGKVVEEIQSKQKISEKEAKKALKEHIDKIKAKLEDGDSHLIRGLGYLYKDEQGSYAFQKKKPAPQAKEEKEPEKSNPVEEVVPPLQKESIETEKEEVHDPDSEIEPPQSEEIPVDEIEPDLIIGQELEEEKETEYEDSTVLGMEEKDGFAENTETLLDDEEESYSYKPILSAEDENVQEYYKRKDDYDNGENKRRPIFTIIAATVIVLLLAAFVLYYFNFYSGDKTQISDNASMSSTKTALSEEVKNNNGSETPASNEENVENENLQEANPEASSTLEEEINSREPDTKVISSTSSFEATKNDKIYSLILGSFKVERNADNFKKHLTSQGIDVNIFRWGGNFHCVGYEQIAGKSNAVKLLAEMREEEPSAWIIRNKQF